MKDFGTSESPKSTRSSTTHWCPGRPGHPAFRHNIASSLRLHTGLPYDWTPRSDAPLGSPLAPSARRVFRVASRLPGTTRLRFALHGGQRGTGPMRLRVSRTPRPPENAGRLGCKKPPNGSSPWSLAIPGPGRSPSAPMTTWAGRVSAGRQRAPAQDEPQNGGSCWRWIAAADGSGDAAGR